MANECLRQRNAQWYDFKVRDGLDLDYILNADMAGLRQGLFEGKFTSVDLVTVFGDRCQRIGRKLNLSTEENYIKALEMAAEKDKQLKEARS